MRKEKASTWREKSRDEKIETVKNGWKAEELVNNKKQFIKWRQENSSMAETRKNEGGEDGMCQTDEMRMYGADVGLSLANSGEMENGPENETRGGVTYDNTVRQSLAGSERRGVT